MVTFKPCVNNLIVEERESWLDCPKFLINDLKKCKTIGEYEWEYNIEAKCGTRKLHKCITFRSVYLQGFIEQKPCDDVMILRDCTGRVKLTHCSRAVDLEHNSISKGSYCSVVGVFVRETGLPEVYAQSLTELEQSDKEMHYKYWPYEVKDFLLFLLNIVKPNLKIVP